MSKRNLRAVLVLVTAGLVSPATPAATGKDRKLTPKALYAALIQVPRERAALPNGYQSPTLGAVPPSATAKRHHAVGAVAIGVTKQGTAGARILYTVFPTHADALANWNEAARVIPKKRVRPPSFLPKPAAMFNATVFSGRPPAKTTSFGATTIAYVTANLIVQVDTSLLSSKKQGDVLGAIALTQFAARHLAAVAGTSAPVKTTKPVAPII